MTTNYQKTNPTHGMAVTGSNKDRKAEHTGHVASDSLAAESLRSNGSFAQGNPTGISGVSGGKGTFAGDVNDESISDKHYGKKEGEKITLDNHAGSKGRIGNVGSLSGGNQTQAAFSGKRDEGLDRTRENEDRGGSGKKQNGGGGRGSQHEGGSTSSTTHTAGKYTNQDVTGSSTGPGQNAVNRKDFPKGDQAPTFKHSQKIPGKADAGTRSSGSHASHGPENVPEQDTRPITNIGSENDPGRIAEGKFARKNASEGEQAAGGGGMGGRSGNMFEGLDVEGRE